MYKTDKRNKEPKLRTTGRRITDSSVRDYGSKWQQLQFASSNNDTEAIQLCEIVELLSPSGQSSDFYPVSSLQMLYVIEAMVTNECNLAYCTKQNNTQETSF